MLNVYNRTKIKQLLQISCLVCRGPTLFSQSVCRYCLESCPIIEQPCRHCGIPILSGHQETCAQCLTTPPPYSQTHCAFAYSYPINHIIHRIKYSNQISLLKSITRPLTEILLERYRQQPWPEAIIPVPLHNKRLRERGYDQAMLLAKTLKQQIRQTEVNLNTKLVRRTRFTPPQQGLKARDRLKNIRGAFLLTSPAIYRHVALVDDVVTTGATVSEIARLLLKEGVTQVDIWCLARTVKI